jgi:hypothetical protein
MKRTSASRLVAASDPGACSDISAGVACLDRHPRRVGESAPKVSKAPDHWRRSGGYSVESCPRLGAFCWEIPELTLTSRISDILFNSQSIRASPRRVQPLTRNSKHQPSARLRQRYVWLRNAYSVRRRSADRRIAEITGSSDLLRDVLSLGQVENIAG